MAGKSPVGKPDLDRLRVRFGKDGRLAYLGHLEVINTIERSVRRASLPFSVGNGFARRIRIQFSQALPVGAASCCEYFDLYLTERIDEAEAFERLVAATPKAMAPTRVAYVGGRLPALEAWLTRSDWTVRLTGEGEAFSAARLDEALASLREAGHIDFMRGDKPRTIGLENTLVSWLAQDGPDDGPWKTIALSLQTRSSNLGALRPQVLLEAAFGQPMLAGANLDALRVMRIAQCHEDEAGELVDPLDARLLVSAKDSACLVELASGTPTSCM